MKTPLVLKDSTPEASFAAVREESPLRTRVLSYLRMNGARVPAIDDPSGDDSRFD